MKVLGVSLGRSGTMSLAHFLKENGIKTKHSYDSFMDKNSFSEDLNGIIKYFETEDKDFDGFVDIPYCFIYEYFIAKYPESKIIYIQRDLNSWIQSMININKMWAYEGDAFIFEKVYCKMYLNTNKTRIQDLTEEELSIIWIEHDKTILNYFNNNKNFLKVSLNDPDIGKKISSFLNVEKNNFLQLNKIESLNPISIPGRN